MCIRRIGIKNKKPYLYYSKHLFTCQEVWLKNLLQMLQNLVNPFKCSLRKKVLLRCALKRVCRFFRLSLRSMLRKHIIFIARIICAVPCVINNGVGEKVLAPAAGARGSHSLSSFGGFAIRSAHPFIYFLHLLKNIYIDICTHICYTNSSKGGEYHE